MIEKILIRPATDWTLSSVSIAVELDTLAKRDVLYLAALFRYRLVSKSGFFRMASNLS